MIVGKTLAGKYLILEQLRRQTFYDLYLGRLVNTEKRFLIKWIKKEYVEPGQTFKKVKPNLMVIASIRHQGIASLRDFGEDESIFLVEDYFDGALLREVIERTASTEINPLQALNLGIKITDALHAAHSRGIVHGQITPESIVVSGDLNPKIADFHLLNFLTAELKTATEFQGRDIRYCSPEIVSGSKPSFESDIYSVGVILYELLTGRPPFERENTLSIALDKVQIEVKSPRELNPGVPRLLESVVLKCIKRNPESRYKNAGELLSELHLCRSSLLRAAAEERKPEAKTSAEQGRAEAVIPTYTSIASQAVQNSADKSVTLGNIVQRKEAAIEAQGRQNPQSIVKSEQQAPPQTARTEPSRPAPAIQAPELENPKLKKELPKGLVPFLIALGVFLALAGVFIGIFMSYFSGGEGIGTVVVPQLVGKSVIEAKALLGNKGLVPVVAGRQSSDEIPEGYILIQTPEAGTNVKKGREIQLILSNGQEKVVVPKLVGMTIEDALEIIKKSQLKLGEQRRELSDQYDEGIVIEQSPEAGEERFVGRRINLVISSGKETRIITMPRVTDLALDYARDILEMNELKNIEVQSVAVGGVREGNIVAQSVLEGTRVAPSQNIIIYTAKPPETDNPVEVKGIVNLNISANEGHQEIVVMVFDQNGAREIYRNVHGPGEALKIPVSGTGGVNVKVYLNGFLLKEQTL